MDSLLSKQTLEKIDNNITYVLNVVWKKIEGPTRTIPYSKTKAIYGACLLFQKTKKKQAQNKYVDVLTMEKGKEQAGIREIEVLSIQQINNNIKKAEDEQAELKAKGKEYREKELLDYNEIEIGNTTEKEK